MVPLSAKEGKEEKSGEEVRGKEPKKNKTDENSNDKTALWLSHAVEEFYKMFMSIFFPY